MSNNIQPKSVNFSQQTNTRDFYKGTSFRWSGIWEEGKLYANDTYFIDCVSYDNEVWMCIKSHYANANSYPDSNSPYWQHAIGPNQMGLPAIHVGPNPPTEEEYGEDYKNVLWIDTTDVTEDEFRVYSAGEIDANFYTKNDSEERFIDPLELQTILDSTLKSYYTKDNINGILTNYPTNSETVTRALLDQELTQYHTKEVSDTLYQPKGEYLSSVPPEYITESELANRNYSSTDFVNLQIEQSLNDYATKTELTGGLEQILSEVDNVEVRLNSTIAGLIGNAPGNLNTIEDIALAIVEIKNELNNIKSLIPTKTSQLINDSGYLTEANVNIHVDLSEYYTKNEVNNLIDFNVDNSENDVELITETNSDEEINQ